MIEIHRGAGALEEAADCWAQLAPRTIFQRHDLALEWWHSFGDGHEPLVLCAADADGAALLPLVLSPDGDGARIIGAGAFDQLDVVSRGVPPLDELGTALRSVVREGVWVDATEADSTLARLVRATFPAHTERLYSAMPLLHTGRRALERFRREHPRSAYRHRRLLGSGQAVVEDVTDRTLAHEVITAAVVLKRIALNEEQRRYFVPDQRFEGWLLALAERHLGGLLRLATLRMDGALAAALLYFVHGDTWSLYFTAYDRRFRADSPGAVLIWEVLERAVTGGVPRVNFLTGEQWYKTRWQDDTVPLHVLAGAASPEWAAHPEP